MFNVYGIFCKTTWRVYYGSTKETVEQRLKEHESHYKCYLKGTRKKYCSSYEILKNNDYKIELLEECDNEIHMIERETYYFDNFECVNKYRPGVPGRTNKEYRETFKVEIAEKNKEYYETNKVEIAEKKKEYYEEHKEKISEKRKEKYSCPCGSTLRKDYKTRHETTLKHKKYLEKLKYYFNKWKKLILKKS